MKKNVACEKHAGCGFVFAAAFVALIVVLKTVDVSEVVGCSMINYWFADCFPFNAELYMLSKYLGVFALFIVGVFAFVGFLQLVKRKRIAKVDSEILLLGTLYIIVGIAYVVFYKVVINLRPVVIDGANESSFPSSHTLLFIVVFMSAAMNSSLLFNSPKLSKIFKVCCILLMVEGVAFRMFCSVHWFTDILGGILLSVSLLEFYRYFRLLVTARKAS